MCKYRKLTHMYYRCDYHIVFTPKNRFQVLEGVVESLVGHDLQVIGTWKDVQIQGLNVQEDHIHLVCPVPPKVSISGYIGILKGKLAIKLFKTYPNLKQGPYWGNHFWSRGYSVGTVGLDGNMTKRYVKCQEHH
ncbi:MAG: IS200/IS605 family transposase [Maribacter sp.]|nr:MAG: IS200/IS605 family transposase [Maribacter sp.]